MTLRKKAKYHHGQLRQEILKAAHAIIKKEGWQQLSLRRIAREIGVSHTAPYHHFPDKISLLASVAEDGFNSLIKELEDQVKKPPEDPESLREAAITYILFANRNPQLYRLMFSFDFGKRKDFPNLASVSSTAYRQIAARMFLSEADNTKAIVEVTMASWAMVHGLSMLLIDHQLDVSVGQEDEIKLIMERMLDIIWIGIANFQPNI